LENNEKRNGAVGNARILYSKATSGICDNFNWSDSMTVYTGERFEFFTAAIPPIETPIPSAIFLFGSVIVGLFGIVRRKPDLQVSAG
jgi:hypothetical protein